MSGNNEESLDSLKGLVGQETIYSLYEPTLSTYISGMQARHSKALEKSAALSQKNPNKVPQLAAKMVEATTKTLLQASKILECLDEWKTGNQIDSAEQEDLKQKSTEAVTLATTIIKHWQGVQNSDEKGIEMGGPK